MPNIDVLLKNVAHSAQEGNNKPSTLEMPIVNWTSVTLHGNKVTVV